MSRLLSNAELTKLRQDPSPGEQALLDHIDTLTANLAFYQAVGVGVTKFAQGLGLAVATAVKKRLGKA